METNRRAQGKVVVDRLRRRSNWAFVLLAALAVASYAMIAAGTADERASAAEINLAGKRRMLSQRIGFLASQALHAPSPERTALLRDGLQQLESTHRTLVEGDPAAGIRPPRSARLRTAYFGAGGVDEAVRDYLRLGRALLDAPPDSARFSDTAAEIMHLAQGDLLTALDGMVGEYQAESERSTDTLRLLQILALLATLLLLAYSARSLLRPLLAEVRTTLDELGESESALQRAGEENRLVLATAGDGIFGVHRDGRISFVNPAAAAMLGVAADDLVGRPHHPYILPGAAGCPICRLSTNGRSIQYCDGEFARAGAAPFPVEYSVAVRPDGDGAVVSFRDISDRRRAELTLQRFQQRLVDAIEAMDDAVALFDADDRLALYNLRFAELFPLPGDVVRIGMPFADLVRAVANNALYATPPADLERWIDERMAAHRLAQGSSEVAFAGDRWMRVTERHTREGGTVVIWSDVSHLKRTLLAADHASRAKSEFLARMSHELRTPLNAILGFAQVLDKAAEAPLAAGQRECVSHILQGGRHLLGLINEVLDLSAIEAGRLEVDMAEVALAPLFGECLALVSPQAADRQVAVAADTGGGLSVHADRIRLKQVLLNLLSNGIKYNRSGGRLTLAVADTGRTVRITVVDTGRGIPPELAARVFLPFDRLGVGKVEGTGIGLAITRRLVELMGGRIDFTSTVGVGTTFHVELAKAGGSAPASVAADPPAAATPPPAAAEAEGPALLAVGLGESDAGLMRLVASTLRGVALVFADDADAARRLLAKRAFQAIIADESMLSVFSGEAPAAPLVVLGDGEAPADGEAGRRRLVKPLKPRETARLLREILQ
ncbi:MAG: PAS-domain containing protein [Rhodocyclaceae bacterium]|nr:PAS-domain containing protein [Rhodocyclaceae bacterium]